MTGNQSDTTTLALPHVAHRHVDVNGLRIFYRESRITVPDYAAAILDALEGGTFVGERFTAAY